MTCTSNDGYFELNDQVPISFDQWKTILSKLKKEEISNQLESLIWFVFFSLNEFHISLFY